MLLKRLTTLLLLSFLLQTSSAFSHIQEQVLNYKVLVNEELKGNLKAKITKQSNSDFSIRLTTSLSIFFLNIISDIQLEYQNGILVSANSTKHINGIQTEHTSVTQKPDHMLVTGSDIDDLRLTDPVSFSVGRLYHAEPEGYNSIFSERLGCKVLLNSIGSNAYELRQPNGARNYFFYKQGICIEMQTRMRGRKVRFVLE
jgi:hypothetical protein